MGTVNEDLLLAVVAAAVNFLLSLVVPALLKDSNAPLAVQLKNHYQCNKNTVLLSSVVTVVFVFVALQINPWVQNNLLANVSSMNSGVPRLV
jgi:hypothetical protein